MKDNLLNSLSALSEAFNVEPVVDTPLDTLKTQAVQAQTDNIEKQRQYVKDTMVAMIEKGKTAIDELQMVARASEKSRDYEVLFGGIKSVTEITEKLLAAEISGKQEDKQTSSSHVQNQQNNIFVGSTAELQRLIKQQRVD